MRKRGGFRNKNLLICCFHENGIFLKLLVCFYYKIVSTLLANELTPSWQKLLNKIWAKIRKTDSFLVYNPCRGKINENSKITVFKLPTKRENETFLGHSTMDG